MASNRTIILKSYNNNRIELGHDDGVLTIYPGCLVEDKADGTCEQNTAIIDGLADLKPVMIVTEHNLAGLGVTDGYKRASATGPNIPVSIWFPDSGDIGLVRVTGSAEIAVLFGSRLSVDATGNFILQTGTNVPLARALEAVTVAADASALVKVRFI